MKSFILFFALTLANSGEDIVAEYEHQIMADNIVQCELIGEEMALPIREDIYANPVTFTEIIPFCREAKNVSAND